MNRVSLHPAVFFLIASIVSADPPNATKQRDAQIASEVDGMFDRLVETRSDFHMYPELSNQEERTGRVIAERLKQLGLEVQSGIAGHGVIALLKGGKPGPVVAVRADMDALPIPETKDVTYRSKNKGVSHACGHDVHMTVALGVAEVLAKHRAELPGTVKFLFQPAEESLGADYQGDWGAKRMVREGALENPRPSAIFGLHSASNSLVDEKPLAVGKLEYSNGYASANSDRFIIKIRGKMAHGASPHRGVDAIVAASDAVMQLQTIRSRRIDTREPIIVTVGMFNAGSRENIIAEEAELRGTVRTYSETIQDEIISTMHRILKGVSESYNATYEMKYRKGYPSIINNEQLVEQMLPTMKRIAGEQNVTEGRPGMGGEDFSYYSREIPAFFYRLGVANEKKGIVAGAHTAEFDADPESLKVGVKVMSAMVWDYLEQHAAGKE